jgi:hypothetical protein
VDEVTNPTENVVYMTMGYFNNLGSDEYTTLTLRIVILSRV